MLRNYRCLLFVLLMVVVWAVDASAAKLVPTVGAKMLLEGGDCLGDEVLAWQRLRAERRVAVPQDDSPPIACLDPAGRVYLATGSGKLLISDDDGKSFFAPVEIKVNGKAIGDLQAMGVLRSTASYRAWVGQARGPIVIVYADNNKLLIARSVDDGATWQSAGELKAAGYGTLKAGGVRITQLANGSLLLALTAWKTNGASDPEGLVYTSKDDGMTWTKLGSLGSRCRGANLLQVKSGELLAAITYQGIRKIGDPGAEIRRKELFNNVVIARSTDGGRSWRDYQCVTRFKESPADLTELSDGTVLLTYGEQNFPYGSRAVVSKDGGKTWSSRAYILGFSTNRPPKLDRPWPALPGYRVSTVALKGDTILTLCTRGAQDLPTWLVTLVAKGSTEDKDKDTAKSVLSVRWALNGLQKPPLGPPAGMTLIAPTNSEGYLDNGRCLINPEHLNFGGDYFDNDEILVYERIAAEHYTVGVGPVPVVCFDPDGNLVVSVGSGQIRRSVDNGRTWTQIGAAPADGPGKVHERWISAFGILRDGTMLIVNNCYGSPPYTEVLRSSDSGKTWSEPVRINSAPFDYMGAGEAYHIVEQPDGTLLITGGNLYLTARKDDLDMPWDGVFRSRDGGKTWGDFSYIGHPACETNLLRLKSGRLMAAIRAQGSIASDDFLRLDVKASGVTNHDRTFMKNTAVTVSDDNGYTWKPYKTVTRFCECAADIVEMGDGTIVMSYQQKNHPNGARATVSRDGGKTWDSTLYMLGWWPMSGGMTSSVVLKDGRVLTVRSGVPPGQITNVTEATIWTPKKAD